MGHTHTHTHTQPQLAHRDSKSEAHKDERKVVVQDDRRTVADIPAAIATAAGLAAESAERESWKLLSLQLADIYMGEYGGGLCVEVGQLACVRACVWNGGELEAAVIAAVRHLHG